MTHVLIGLVAIIVVVTSPERSSLMVLRVLEVTVLVVVLRLVVDVVVGSLELAVMLSPMRSGVLIAVVHHVLLVGHVGIE